MWIIIFFAVIGAIVGHVLAARQHATAKEQYFFAPFFGSAVGIFLISFVMLFFIADRLPTKWVTESSAKLVSLRDKSSVDGSFILGTGNIAEKDYFVYYREWGGGFKKEKLPADNSVIFEGSQSATLVVKKRVYEEEWMNSFFIRNDAINVRSYEFHVPKGTIMQKFSVE